MNWTDFHFIRPYWLLALLPYSAALIFLVRHKLSQGNWTAVCDSELLPYLLQSSVVKQSRLPLAAGALAAFLAIAAMAGPTLNRLPTPVLRNDSALVIALNLSRSMDAGDIKPSRLTMARYKIADILKQRKDGQTALIVFADDAFTVTPLTNDTQTIDSQLSALTSTIMPGDGNNIDRALQKSVDLLKQAGLQKGQILLLTDGGNIDQVISQAKSLGDYQLLVLGVGTAEGAPIALENGGFLKDAQGGIIVDKLDAGGLEKLAQAGNGAYQALTPDDTDINALLATVAAKLQEQGQKNENMLLEQWNDLGPWLLLIVLPLAALSFRKGLLVFALMVFLPFPKNSYALDWQGLWQTKDQQAQEAYNKKEYDKAAELFENPDWKAAAQYNSDLKDIGEMKTPKTATGFYNQGNVLAKSGKLKEALDAYNNALKLKHDDDDTKFNKDLVEKALEKQKQEQQQNKDDKQQDNKKDSKDKKDQKKNKGGNKSDQPDQKNQDEQKDSDKKPEQKPEQSKDSTEQQPDKKEQEEQKQEQAKPEQTEQQKNAQEEKQKPDVAKQVQETEQSKEEKQAAEQWLKRIPDDPAGLLRRKFKYQYDQRGQQ